MTWMPQNSPDGDFFVNAGGYAVSYLAMALYSPTTQLIRFSYFIDDTLKIYLDGTMVIEEQQCAGSREQPAIGHLATLGSGWHQLFIKVADVTGLSIFRLKIEGVALGWSYELPLAFPAGLEVISPNSAVKSMLHLGISFYDTLAGSFSPGLPQHRSYRKAATR